MRTRVSKIGPVLGCLLLALLLAGEPPVFASTSADKEAYYWDATSPKSIATLEIRYYDRLKGVTLLFNFAENMVQVDEEEPAPLGPHQALIDLVLANWRALATEGLSPENPGEDYDPFELLWEITVHDEKNGYHSAFGAAGYPGVWKELVVLVNEAVGREVLEQPFFPSQALHAQGGTKEERTENELRALNRGSDWGEYHYQFLDTLREIDKHREVNGRFLVREDRNLTQYFSPSEAGGTQYRMTGLALYNICYFDENVYGISLTSSRERAEEILRGKGYEPLPIEAELAHLGLLGCEVLVFGKDDVQIWLYVERETEQIVKLYVGI